MLKKNSITAFADVGALLRIRTGVEYGEVLLKEIIRTLGQGEKVIVPNVAKNEYTWLNHSNDRDPGKFEDLLKVLLKRFIKPAHAAQLFKEVIIELGPGAKLTVPRINSGYEGLQRRLYKGLIDLSV